MLDKKVIESLKALYLRHKGTYTIERMTYALKSVYGIKCNHKKIYRLMTENGYLSIVRPKKHYRKGGSPHPKYNVLNRNFKTSCPYDKLATDITEINKNGKKIYISPIKDLHTKVIEAVEIGYSQSMQLTVKMIEKIKDKAIPYGTIIHSSFSLSSCSLIYSFIALYDLWNI